MCNVCNIIASNTTLQYSQGFSKYHRSNFFECFGGTFFGKLFHLLIENTLSAAF
jgi:hypothetical protein